MMKALATHEFLNLRTYVRHGDEAGIYFLAEWIPSRLATLIGPRLYGLPYRLGHLDYTTRANGRLARCVTSPDGWLRCTAQVDSCVSPAPSPVGSEAEFLLERYTAFTKRNGLLRRFRIRHDPWLQTPARVKLNQSGMFDDFTNATSCGAHYSTGVTNVRISCPQRISANPTQPQPAVPRASDRSPPAAPPAPDRSRHRSYSATG